MNTTLGKKIAELRQGKGMTQLDLAQRMGVTDKAVSKWERDLSYPDISSFPRLAEILGVSIDELMQSNVEKKVESGKIDDVVGLILRSIALAMGVAVTVLSIMDALDTRSAFSMLGIGLFSLALHMFRKEKV